MSDSAPVEIEITDPKGLVPDWAEHELRFTTHHGPNLSNSNVQFLTDDELKALYVAVGDRLVKTVPMCRVLP